MGAVEQKQTWQAGFSLIELMVAVAIMAILLAIAVPAYQKYVIRANRVEAVTLLNEAAARQERYYAQNNAYVTSDSSIDSLGMRNSGASDNDLYQLSLAEGDDDDGGYVLTAIAQNTQAKDSECGSFTLNAAGVRGSSGSESASTCW